MKERYRYDEIADEIDEGRTAQLLGWRPAPGEKIWIRNRFEVTDLHPDERSAMTMAHITLCEFWPAVTEELQVGDATLDNVTYRPRIFVWCYLEPFTPSEHGEGPGRRFDIRLTMPRRLER